MAPMLTAREQIAQEQKQNAALVVVTEAPQPEGLKPPTPHDLLQEARDQLAKEYEENRQAIFRICEELKVRETRDDELSRMLEQLSRILNPDDETFVAGQSVFNEIAAADSDSETTEEDVTNESIFHEIQSFLGQGRFWRTASEIHAHVQSSFPWVTRPKVVSVLRKNAPPFQYKKTKGWRCRTRPNSDKN